MSQSLELLSQRKDLKKGILILDSGLGAISMLQEIHDLLPDVPLIAVADSAAFPYGDKADSDVIERVNKISQYFSVIFDPSVVVLACNTASTLALPYLRSSFTIPIVGIVPAVKPAAQMSKTQTIAILATPATINRPYLTRLIEEFAADCSVLCIPCPTLASLAEQKLRGLLPSLAKVRSEITSLIEHEAFDAVDTVVLACTHFSFLLDELRELLPNREILDPASSVAKQVKRVNQLDMASASSVNSLVFTGSAESEMDADLEISGIDEIFFCSI